jgi:hypothetical protein
MSLMIALEVRHKSLFKQELKEKKWRGNELNIILKQ